jgi:putative serine protease PepD
MGHDGWVRDHDDARLPPPPPSRPVAQSPVSSPQSNQPATIASRPARPPVYDPAHYGYGPWRPVPDAEPVDLPPLEPPATGWRRLGGPAVAMFAGAALAAFTILLAVVIFDSGPSRTETVVQFPELGPSTILEGDVLDIQGVLAKVRPSVVTINTGLESRAGNFEGAGSGVVIGEDGLILTNAHVIADADTIEVTFFDGSVKTATVVGTFPDDDIAIVDADDISGLQPADLGSAEDLRVGDDVVAIGNALDLGSTPSVTKGIVSAKDRTIEDTFIRLENLIQTDAAINPGNSGGPLVNAAGQVVGINTAIIDNAQNIGFAISIDVVRPLIDRALDGDADLSPDTAFLGVTSISLANLDPSVQDEFGVSVPAGAFVQDVVAGSPAEAAGIARGDVVTEIAGEAITSAEDVARIVRSRRPGDVVTVVVQRDGGSRPFDVELVER